MKQKVKKIIALVEEMANDGTMNRTTYENFMRMTNKEKVQWFELHENQTDARIDDAIEDTYHSRR